MNDETGQREIERFMFPKNLHQTWRTTDLSDIPEFDACARSWKAHHPDYEYHLWDDRENAEFVQSVFPSFHDTWVSFDKNIKRIDSIRYMWMYHFGGIYADLDMECLRPLDELTERHADSDVLLFCDFDGDGNLVSANPALLISRPGSEFWLEMLEYTRVHRDEYVIQSTGPGALAAVANACAAHYGVHCLDQNRLFIRKRNKPAYVSIAGNERDFEIYKDVFCTTAKPAKYDLDRKTKFVADWHGTPKQYKWRNEYRQKTRSPGWRSFAARLRRLLRL